jgi:hypothetical protein
MGATPVLRPRTTKCNGGPGMMVHPYHSKVLSETYDPCIVHLVHALIPEGLHLMDERQMALPKLYGAPAYRPPRRATEAPRPFDPDELPISAFRTRDEAELVESLPAEAFTPGGRYVAGQSGREEQPEEPQRRGLGRIFGRN